MEKLITYLAIGLGGIVIIAGISIICSFPLMWCWNYVMPTLFGLKTIDWMQAWCLMFVANCLIRPISTATKT